MSANGSTVEVKGDADSSETGRQLREKIVPNEEHRLAHVSDTIPFHEPRIAIFPPIPLRHVPVDQSIELRALRGVAAIGIPSYDEP